MDARGRQIGGDAGDHEHVEVWIDGVPCLRYHLFGGWITLREPRARERRRRLGGGGWTRPPLA